MHSEIIIIDSFVIAIFLILLSFLLIGAQFFNRSCYSYGAVNVNQLAILTVNDIHSAGNPCDIRG